MVDIRKAIPRKSEYLAAEDLDGRGDVKVTIRSVDEVRRPSHWGRADTRTIFVVSFEGVRKGLWIGRANSRLIASWHGYDTDKWPGKEITLYATTTKMSGKVVPCIRVRENKLRRVSNEGYER
jgi:hypothetical protein